MKTTKYKDIDEYIADFPENARILLEQFRSVIKKVAPEAVEVISYNMPAIKQNGIVVYFAAHKNHIGLYPMASGIATFKDEIAQYKSSKGAVQFPIDQPLPVDLISRIVDFRLQENIQKAKLKKIKSSNISG